MRLSAQIALENSYPKAHRAQMRTPNALFNEFLGSLTGKAAGQAERVAAAGRGAGVSPREAWCA
ncbi:MAG: hypothetical protein JO015_14495 [Verrucomicrobia bacterium]|nr:hypothetical protein [Verrucomicrobiota bacterium]